MNSWDWSLHWLAPLSSAILSALCAIGCLWERRQLSGAAICRHITVGYTAAGVFFGWCSLWSLVALLPPRDLVRAQITMGTLFWFGVFVAMLFFLVVDIRNGKSGDRRHGGDSSWA